MGITRPLPRAANGAAWQMITDRVMGGVSSGSLQRETVADRPALRLRGTVSLENNGGFVQMALDLTPNGAAVDLSAYDGFELEVQGNGETYGLHLRTSDTVRPWQSYRQTFRAGDAWQTLTLPFCGFKSHRLDAPLDLTQARRIGLIAIGRAFTADLSLARIGLCLAAR